MAIKDDLDSVPRVLYKYFAPERADVVSRRLVRYTPLGAFNDPFEGRPSFTTLAPEEETLETFRSLMPTQTKQAYDDLPLEIRSRLPFEAFSQLLGQFAASQEPQLLTLLSNLNPLILTTLHKKVDEFIGVLSLSEVPDSLLMWSHYAASHTGFIVGFNPRHPYFHERKGPNDELRHIRRVVYREMRPRGAITGIEGVDVFLVKSGHWNYEREWRILRPLNDAHSTLQAEPFPIHLFQFPADALSDIIIGARALEQTKEILIDLIRGDHSLHHVRMRQSMPHDEDFLLQFIDVAV